MFRDAGAASAGGKHGDATEIFRAAGAASAGGKHGDATEIFRAAGAAFRLMHRHVDFSLLS
jgi:hypothetical protein